MAARLLQVKAERIDDFTLGYHSVLDGSLTAEVPTLERNARVDVVVVGGGITGLTAAHVLAKAGRSVALLERGRCADIDTGQGKILDIDGTRVAAYRDPSGATVVRSAACTHMGCAVGWNDAERTWDCPCH